MKFIKNLHSFIDPLNYDYGARNLPLLPRAVKANQHSLLDIPGPQFASGAGQTLQPRQQRCRRHLLLSRVDRYPSTKRRQIRAEIRVDLPCPPPEQFHLRQGMKSLSSFIKFLIILPQKREEIIPLLCEANNP